MSIAVSRSSSSQSRPVRRPVLDLGLAQRAVDVAQRSRALRAQPPARDRRVGVALDLDDPLVLDVDLLAAAHRAVGADRLDHPVRVLRARARGLCERRDCAALPSAERFAQLAQQRRDSRVTGHRCATYSAGLVPAPAWSSLSFPDDRLVVAVAVAAGLVGHPVGDVVVARPRRLGLGRWTRCRSSCTAVPAVGRTKRRGVRRPRARAPVAACDAGRAASLPRSAG